MDDEPGDFTKARRDLCSQVGEEEKADTLGTVDAAGNGYQELEECQEEEHRNWLADGESNDSEDDDDGGHDELHVDQQLEPADAGEPGRCGSGRWNSERRTLLWPLKKTAFPRMIEGMNGEYGKGRGGSTSRPRIIL